MNEPQPTPLLALSRTELEEFMVARGHKPFHGRQLYSWIHEKAVTEFDEMTDLSKDLRAELNETATVGMPKLVEIAAGDGPDSATKFLFDLGESAQVEAVYIPADDRVTVCLSSQVGCAFGCRFCATAMLGLTRNMTVAEIIGTFIAVKQHAPARISNVVFMGMGEPLANLTNVMGAWDRLTDPNGIWLSKRKVTISTVGLPQKIRELATYEYPPKLVFSIGSPHQEWRKKMLPVAGRYSLKDMHDALSEYSEATRNRITIALLVADGLNDSPEDARLIHKWLGNLPAKVNLLRYNEAAGDFRRPDEAKIEAVAAELARLGRTVILRRSRGRDIAAACGQLAARQIHNPS